MTTKIPGLSPFADDAPQGLHRDRQTPPQEDARIRLPSLRPAASPTNTYVRPAPAPQRNELADLADSLSGLNPALARFGSAWMEGQKDDTEARVLRKLQGAGSSDAVDKLIDTDPDVKTAFGNAAAMRFAAQQNASRALAAISTDYQNGFDKQNGDFDAFALERYKPYLDKYGDNKEYISTFTQYLQPGLARVKAGDVAMKSQQQYDQTQQGLMDSFGAVAGKAKADSGRMANVIRSAAQELGTTPEDLATVISYESGFSTTRWGGKGSNYMGLIQFGPAERKQFGVHAGQSFEEQMGSVVKFLKARGFAPGMGILDLYSTINAGSPGHYDASDGNGTVRSHVAKMQAEHRGRVAALLGGDDANAQATAIGKEMEGNQRFLGMAIKDQRQALVTFMGTAAAAGNYDLVNSLANMKVKGVDGSEHTLLMDGYVGSDVAKLVKQAEAARDENNHKAGIDTRQGLFDKFTQGEATPDDEVALRKVVKEQPGLVSEAQANSWISHNRNLQESARTQAAKTETKAQLAASYASQEAALDNSGIEAVKSGNLYDLPQMSVIDKEGNPKTLTKEENRKRAIQAFEKESTRIAQRDGEAWQQTVTRELPIYAQNGIVPQGWKDIMSNGVDALSVGAISGQGLPEPTMRAYEMYKLLRANKAVMLRDLIPSDKAEVFEDAMIDEIRLGLDPAKAMMAAVDTNNDPTGKGKEFQKVGVKKVQEMAASGYIVGHLPSWLGGNAETDNSGYVSSTIGIMAERYAARGISPEKAIDQAAERFKNSHVNVNGWWIDASDKRLPANFSDLANARIEDYVARFGKAEGVDMSDLTIRPAANGYGAWAIVHKGTGVPVDQWKGSVFTARDLQETAAGLKKDALTQSAQRARDTTVKTQSWPQGKPEGLENMPYMNMVPKKPEQAPLMEGARRDPKLTTGLIPRRMKPRTLRQQYGLAPVEYED
ncbi:hypothetical protein BA190_24000 [Labrys sp. WJW]|uniref:hypothetical protein n=1 Tax=Labrys sp. WJW TaxID=1737983 RepID=UPI00082BB233|nr:hypothetical protein [Labrys sp. WJW]OCC02391.1 hypothetical protein BA190_24000 [Labrys sp. WJW]